MSEVWKHIRYRLRLRSFNPGGGVGWGGGLAAIILLLLAVGMFEDISAEEVKEEVKEPTITPQLLPNSFPQYPLSSSACRAT